MRRLTIDFVPSITPFLRPYRKVYRMHRHGLLRPKDDCIAYGVLVVKQHILDISP